jgi:hypothetical protein
MPTGNAAKVSLANGISNFNQTLAVIAYKNTNADRLPNITRLLTINDDIEAIVIF